MTPQMLIIGKNLLSARNVSVATFDFDGVGAHGDRDVEAVFEQSQVFVAGSKQGFDVGADLDLGLHLGSVLCLLGPSAIMRDWTSHRQADGKFADRNFGIGRGGASELFAVAKIPLIAG